ncbi:MAG: hypothetical protein U5K77_01435 [Candidatus Saccharibacteria bacterium]|nr:hypothetical protein [Candidatus Saccharibacteria bacterium]
MNRYGLALLGAIIAVIVIVVLIAVRLMTPSADIPVEQVDVTDYVDTSATVRYTVQGNIVGQDEFNAVRISVTKGRRTVEQLSGYTGSVVNRQTYPNNQAAFEAFLYALDKAGYTEEQVARSDDERGMCPFGRRFIMEIEEEGDEVSRLWATSCSRRDGSFGGDMSTVRKLFEAQITDYRDLTSGLGIR